MALTLMDRGRTSRAPRTQIQASNGAGRPPSGSVASMPARDSTASDMAKLLKGAKMLRVAYEHWDKPAMTASELSAALDLAPVASAVAEVEALNAGPAAWAAHTAGESAAQIAALPSLSAEGMGLSGANTAGMAAWNAPGSFLADAAGFGLAEGAGQAGAASLGSGLASGAASGAGSTAALAGSAAGTAGASGAALGAGAAAAGAGGAASGTASGATAGSSFGPLGTLGGAAIGALAGLALSRR